MILLSFDIEEFDMPFEYNRSIKFTDQIKISAEGVDSILNLLDKYNIKATFFSTVKFAVNAPEVLKKIVDKGHEIASHSYEHGDFKIEHLQISKEKLEELTNQKVIGFRMPKMQPVEELEVFKAGYKYNSSLNPTYIPGRYNNFNKPRAFFKEKGVLQIPASVSPLIRFPLFWLSFHNLPLSIYKFLCKQTLKKDKYINLYFHSWEFTDLNQKKQFNIPKYISRNSGNLMIERIDSLIQYLKNKNYKFLTFKEFVQKIEE
jgi:hypothetical protein